MIHKGERERRSPREFAETGERDVRGGDVSRRDGEAARGERERRS